MGKAHYDSLQLKAEKSYHNGLYFLMGYTYSRTFDSGMPDGLGTFPGATYYPLPGTSRADWGLSALNLNNQFTASVIYDLPFGKGKRYGADWNGGVNAILVPAGTISECKARMLAVDGRCTTRVQRLNNATFL